MIIVTGASQGLGKAITERLADKGEYVIGLARSVSRMNIEAYSCDVSNYSSVKKVAYEIKQKKNRSKHL